MCRADTFTDGRLLRVSPEARLLALVLESLAESTGVVRRDPHELRSAAGFYLGTADGMPPTRDQIESLCDELTAVRWALDYELEGMRLLYLQGFGNRQKGLNVCIGVEQANGTISAHLPLPWCVQLVPFVEKNDAVRKYLPQHCERDYSSCPCESYPNGSATLHEHLVNGEEKRTEESGAEEKALDLNGRKKNPSSREGNAGRDEGRKTGMEQEYRDIVDAASVEERRRLDAAVERLGNRAAERALSDAEDYAEKRGVPLNVDHLLFYLEAALERHQKAVARGDA